MTSAPLRSAAPSTDGGTGRREQSHGLAPHSVSENDAFMHIDVVERPLPHSALELPLCYQAAADGVAEACLGVRSHAAVFGGSLDLGDPAAESLGSGVNRIEMGIRLVSSPRPQPERSHDHECFEHDPETHL